MLLMNFAAATAVSADAERLGRELASPVEIVTFEFADRFASLTSRQLPCKRTSLTARECDAVSFVTPAKLHGLFAATSTQRLPELSNERPM